MICIRIDENTTHRSIIVLLFTTTLLLLDVTNVRHCYTTGCGNGSRCRRSRCSWLRGHGGSVGAERPDRPEVLAAVVDELPEESGSRPVVLVANEYRVGLLDLPSTVSSRLRT